MEKVRSSYQGKKAIVTGGLGFIGSNLVLRLVDLGARVTVIDSLVRCCGANEYNIRAVRSDVSLIEKDIAEAADFRKVLASSDVIFNLAGEVSHVHSMMFPERDAELNATAQLRFVRECARAAPGVRIVYAGTRQMYGRPLYLPVDENHPVGPVDINGIHKYAAVMYHLTCAHGGALDSVVLNLTNVYGPRMALDVPCQGVLGNFIRRLLLGRPLEIFGDGRQLRDPLYVDDAVEAFLAAGAARNPHSQLYNVGGPAALELREIAEIARRAAGGPPALYRAFPPESQRIDIGSYYADSGLITRELGWRPRTPFDQGMERTLEFYRAEQRHYLDPARPDPQCQLLGSASSPQQRYAVR
jgi:nucleoside-diphosphate-sugar epimerase